MNRVEAVKILAIVRACYPQVKILDAESMVNSWVWVLGEFDADLVLKAAQIHVSKSKFFPTPADIRENITRAAVFQSSKAALESGQKAISSGTKPVDLTDDDVEELCRFCGLGYENDN